MSEINAYYCTAQIPNDFLDHNRKKKGFIMGYRVLFDHDINDGEKGIFFPFGSRLSEKVLNILEKNQSLKKTIKLKNGNQIAPHSFEGSVSEGLFIPERKAEKCLTGTEKIGDALTSEKYISLLSLDVDYFENDLRNRINNIPKDSVIYIVEKLEGINIDISFKKTIFGKWKYDIESELHLEEVKKILIGILLDKSGKVIIKPLDNEKLHLKVIGRYSDGYPLKRVEVTKEASLAGTLGKDISFDYGLKKYEIYVTSIERKISKKETIYYTWKTIQNRTKKMKLKTAPFLRKEICVDSKQILTSCIGLTVQKSKLYKNQFIKGINLYIEHEDMIDRIPYYSFEYIDTYYNSLYIYRKLFNLGL